MKTQEKFTLAMRRIAIARDLDLIIDTTYANVGLFSFQRHDSFAPILTFPFNFQGAKGSFTPTIGGSDPGPLGPRHEDTPLGFLNVEGDGFDMVALRVEELLDAAGVRPASVPTTVPASETPIFSAKYHRADGGTEIVMVTKREGEKFRIVREGGDDDLVEKGDLSSFVPQRTGTVVVLNDGETFSEIQGSKVYEVPETWPTEEVENALVMGALAPAGDVVAPGELKRSEDALTECQHAAYEAIVELEKGELHDPLERAEAALNRVNEIAEGGEASPRFKALLAAADAEDARD